MTTVLDRFRSNKLNDKVFITSRLHFGTGQVIPIDVSSLANFVVSWHDLTYALPKKNITILQGLNGYFQSGHVTAFMGPSGSGKTTLIECICGQRINGRGGRVTITGLSGKIKISVVPQHDYLLQKLTVRETIAFATKFNGLQQKVVYRIIDEFDLGSCAEVRVSKCSGGQKKRLSIAIEYLSKPDILILDEPTTGLDTPSAVKVISLMSELVGKERIAVVTSIHQPNAELFHSFHHLYILGVTGQCLYIGSPKKMLETLLKIGIPCPPFTNPADFIIEVASADYGFQWIDKLAEQAKEVSVPNEAVRAISLTSLQPRHNNVSRSVEMKALFYRSSLTTQRNLLLTVLRIIAMIGMPISTALFISMDIGLHNGCPLSKSEMYSQSLESVISNLHSEFMDINYNLAGLTMAMLSPMFISWLPCLLTFPKEIQVLRKEYSNGHYSCFNYYVMRILAEMPLQIISPICYSALFYNLTSQPPSGYRQFQFTLANLFCGIIGHCHADFISAIFLENPMSAIYVGPIVMLILMSLCGFFIKIPHMPYYIRPISYLSFLRFGFECIMVAIFGHSLCQRNLKEEGNLTQPFWVKGILQIERSMDANLFLNDDLAIEDFKIDDSLTESERVLKAFGYKHHAGSESWLMSFFDLQDSSYWTSLGILVLHWIVLRAVTFYFIRWKVEKRE